MEKRSIGMVLTPKFRNNKRRVENYLNLKPAINPIESSLLDQTTSNSVISSTLNDLSNWARLSSLWPLLYGTSCCFIEFASLIGSRFDFDRYGLVPRSSPRQADLLITAGTVTMKMAPSLLRLYEQMPEPKYVIAMGACTITGGMFSTDSYSTVRGVDKLIPVDIYLSGCPPVLKFYPLLEFHLLDNDQHLQKSRRNQKLWMLYSQSSVNLLAKY
ncbi:NAD(P)H-quinone oxidoreductase subunit K, chloroplastic-like [Cryptomeria japonica]|uniref:NAD(P)H-quinone oxidoreductase subunit K, chloroplastic-like n=1 Tax=Cryptomeria japonica TaxID=3369 RepID=UPI0027DA356D|nr:NAD(P)H-quinone oxidoreductase subunit K, chloroplastic-like [Cryptomeria japonica]